MTSEADESEIVRHVEIESLNEPQVTETAATSAILARKHTPTVVKHKCLKGNQIVIPLHADYRSKFPWNAIYAVTCQCCLPKVTKHAPKVYVKYDLPKIPIVGYILFKHLGEWDGFNLLSKFVIYFCIYCPAILQMVTAIVLLFGPLAKIDEEISAGSDSIIWQYQNLLAVCFLLFYFSTHLSDIIVISKTITRAQDYYEDRTNLASFTTSAFAISQFFALLFIFYAGLFRIMVESETSQKFEFAVAVFTVMQLDEWIYKFGVEPMNMIDDDLFAIYIQQYGTLQQIHARQIYFHFWGMFVCFIASGLLGIIFFNVF